jgi:hypothetical protein
VSCEISAYELVLAATRGGFVCNIGNGMRIVVHGRYVQCGVAPHIDPLASMQNPRSVFDNIRAASTRRPQFLSLGRHLSVDPNV